MEEVKGKPLDTLICQTRKDNTDVAHPATGDSNFCDTSFSGSPHDVKYRLGYVVESILHTAWVNAQTILTVPTVKVPNHEDEGCHGSREGSQGIALKP